MPAPAGDSPALRDPAGAGPARAGGRRRRLPQREHGRSASGRRRGNRRLHRRIPHRLRRPRGLYARQRTGRGQRVDVNLLNSILNLHIQEFTLYLNGAGLPERSRSDIPGAYLGAPYGFYRTADDYIAIAMNPINKLAALVGVAGYEECAESQVMEGRDKVRADFQEGSCRKTTQEWLDILLAEDIWCAPVNDYAAVERSAGPRERDDRRVGAPEGSPVRGVGIPVKFSETPRRDPPPRPAPRRARGRDPARVRRLQR